MTSVKDAIGEAKEALADIKNFINEEKEAISYSNVMLGFALLSKAFRRPEGMARALHGDYDRIIGMAAFTKDHDRLPTEEELSGEFVVKFLENMKRVIRADLQNAINAIDRNLKSADKAEKLHNARVVAEGFKAMSVPAPEGTVDELCKKYNVSKSHVRTLKREGRLHELGNPV